MKKIIVTGGLGFIGSNLINILQKKYFIINIDKVSYASNHNNIDPYIKNYKFYKQDINNKIFIQNFLELLVFGVYPFLLAYFENCFSSYLMHDHCDHFKYLSHIDLSFVESLKLELFLLVLSMKHPLL